MSSEEPRDPIDTSTRTLSLAIQLVDAYTGRPFSAKQLARSATGTERGRRTVQRRGAAGAPTVSIRGVAAEPVTNPSGYLLYFTDDLPRDTGEVEIEVAGGRRYVDERSTVDLAELDSRNPVETIDLQPLPAYRFPSGATLVRGHVFVLDEDVDDEEDIDPRRFGEDGVKLTIESLDRATETVTHGEFVLFITGLTADIVDDGLVRVDGDRPRLRLEHEEFEDASIPIEISEGRTRCYHVKYDVDENVAYRECDADDWTSLTP